MNWRVDVLTCSAVLVSDSKRASASKVAKVYVSLCNDGDERLLF